LNGLSDFKTKPLVVVTGAHQKQIRELTEIPAGLPVILSNEEYASAGDYLLKITGNLKALEAVHEDIASPLKDSMASVKLSITKLAAFFEPHKVRLRQAKMDITTAMSAYLRQEETKRKEAQKLLDDAAAKEKARIKALADEAARKAAKEAQDAQDLAVKLAKEGKLKASQEAAAKATKIETTASVRRDIADAKIASLDAPKVATEAPKAAGTTKRKTWQFSVLFDALVPAEYKIVDDRLIRRAIIMGVRDIPGIRIYEQDDVVLTGK